MPFRIEGGATVADFDAARSKVERDVARDFDLAAKSALLAIQEGWWGQGASTPAQRSGKPSESTGLSRDSWKIAEAKFDGITGRIVIDNNVDYTEYVHPIDAEAGFSADKAEKAFDKEMALLEGAIERTVLDALLDL